MLYSIGKDSSGMLHLALKAFYPSILPFPLVHVDTLWKFNEMIEFRDKRAKLKKIFVIYCSRKYLYSSIVFCKKTKSL
jgi:sulfate adenylyltransferase subunit 2